MQCGHAALGRELAFPDDNHVPPGGLQQLLVAAVPLAVVRDFVLPELGVGLEQALVAVVSVPKASVDKDGRSPLAHDDVGPPRQRLDI